VDFETRADYTSETAESNPEWKLDINDEVVAKWRGEQGNVADMTLVWGVPMIPGGTVVTAELANLAVDQCQLIEERFTLLAPDDYRSDLLEIKLWDRRGDELASESLYVDEEDEDEEEEDDGEETGPAG
jgi:ABC-type phosphate/phosphonate transport system substrate-binding protein